MIFILHTSIKLGILLSWNILTLIVYLKSKTAKKMVSFT